MTYQQWKRRRQYKRYDSDLSVRFREFRDESAELREGGIRNVSRGGIFIRTKDPYPAGTELRLFVAVVTPFGETEELEAVGKVVWVTLRTGEEGMGVNFTKIGRHSQYAMLACAYRGEE